LNSRERLLMALAHREPDRVPFDVGGAAQTGMHVAAYRAVRRRLGLPAREARAAHITAQMAVLDEDFLDKLGVDTRFIPRRSTLPEMARLHDEGEYWGHTDEWGVAWRMPKKDGLYYDMHSHPFDVAEIRERADSYSWPDPRAAWRFEGIREQAKRARENGKLVVVNGLCAGILEVYSWLRGYTRFYCDLASEPETAAFFLDKLADLKAAFWEQALAEAGEYIDVVNETDDLAGQDGPLFSPRTYRELVKPRHRELFARIKRAAPDVRIFLHSCGAVRQFIPDFIEMGVDILNPIQVAAKDMDLRELKREFGKDIVFWGGGIDAQHVLSNETPEKIRDAVRRHIDILAPGGGFVFAADHVVQADVPPENFVAMWEAVRTFGGYS